VRHFHKTVVFCCGFLLTMAWAPLKITAQTAALGANVSRTQTHTLAPTQNMMPPAPLVAPLFVNSADVSSSLVLVNPTTKSASAQVLLRNLQGTVITTQTVSVPASSRLDVSIGELLRSASSSETTGSLVVRRDGKNIAAALSLTDNRQGSASYLDEELAMPMSTSSPMLRSVADDAAASPIISITSIVSVLQHVTIRCLPEHGAAVSRTISLPPNATVLSRGCVASSEPAISFQSVADAPDNSAAGAVGIELSSDGPAGGFAAFGLADHRSGASEYFSAAVFDDPMMKKSSTTIFAGVPVGSALQLASGTYTPMLTLSNFGTKVASVTVTLAAMNGNSPQTRTIEKLQIGAGQTKLLTMQGLNGDQNMQNSFLVKSDAPAGELFVKLAATSDGPLHEVEVLAKDAQSGYDGGGHPWSIADGNESTLILFNDSTDAQRFNVAIGYGSGKAWRKQYTLAPMQTFSLGIRELIEGRKEDDHGNVLPSTLTEGDVLWNTRVNAGQGRLLESNPATAMARNFSCYFWYFISNIWFNGPTAVTSGEQFSEDSSYQTSVDTDDINECFASYDTSDSLFLDYSWTIGNSSALQQVDCGSSASSCVLRGAATGQSSVSVTAFDGTCSASAGPVTVNIVTASLTLRAQNTQSVSLDNSTRSQYISDTGGTDQLGFFVGGPSPAGCLAGTEMVGFLAPSSYTGQINLHRTVLSIACYNGSTAASCGSAGPDDSDAAHLDSDPQSGGSQGKVYDIDTPGLLPSSSTPQRFRVNFEEYAALPDGTRISPPLDYYVVLSCSRDLSGVHFVLDVQNDNTIGLGTTPLSWNLQ
jgi:hypothetical protein